MSSPYLSEIRAFAFGFQPKGWMLCNGQILAINQNAALFALLGTVYGGNGTTTFQLPNLQGRVPLHFGNAPSGSPYIQGQIGGEVNHTLSASEMPQHIHTAGADSAAPTINSPAGAYPTTLPQAYSASAPSSPTFMAPSASTGSGTGHNNQSPYSVVSFCIAIQGIFPSRN